MVVDILETEKPFKVIHSISKASLQALRHSIPDATSARKAVLK